VFKAFEEEHVRPLDAGFHSLIGIQRSLIAVGSSLQREMKKKLSGHLLKISVSAFLLWILVASIGTSELQEALYSTKPSFILLALCINGCATLLGVYRWKILLAVQKIFVPFRTLLSISLVSGFFSAFLPSAFGGDVVRGYDMFKYSNKLAGVLASIRRG
jgi:hypothetical protein